MEEENKVEDVINGLLREIWRRSELGQIDAGMLEISLQLILHEQFEHLLNTGILERLMARAGVRCTDPNFTSANFGVGIYPSEQRTLEVATLEVAMRTEQIIDRAAMIGRGPESAAYLVQHAINDPTAGIERTVVALGSQWISHGDEDKTPWVPVLWSGGGVNLSKPPLRYISLVRIPPETLWVKEQFAFLMSEAAAVDRARCEHDMDTRDLDDQPECWEDQDE